MARLVIKTEGNSVTIGTNTYQKGRVFYTETTNGIIINGHEHLVSEVECNGMPKQSKAELLTWLNENLFNDGGSDGGSGSQGKYVLVSDLSTLPEGNKVPHYSPQGMLSTNFAEFPENAVPLAQLDSRLLEKVDLVNGKVPESQLPSYIDNVQEYSDLSSFPIEGEHNIIYLDIENSLAYRWGGTTYVQIGSGIGLGETSTTAYRGDRGKIAYDHIARNDNPHNVTASDVGLGNVNNTSDADKPVSSATQFQLSLKENKSEKNQAGGYVGLDNSGKIPLSLINVSSIATLNALSQKQDLLSSGANIKTINGQSILGSGDMTVNTNQVTNSYVANNVRINEYSNRTEYLAKINLGATIAGSSYHTVQSNVYFPSGISIDGASEHYISIRNNERTVNINVFDTVANGRVSVGYYNTWTSSITVVGTAFIKLVYYK